MAWAEDQDGPGSSFLYFLEHFSICRNIQPLPQEGLFTILVGVIGIIFVPSTPRDSQFLTESQKESGSNLYTASLHVLTLLSFQAHYEAFRNG